MPRKPKDFWEKLSWKAIVAAIITAPSLFFAFPDYIFNLRPQIADVIGWTTLTFIEGTVFGAVVSVVVLKVISDKTKNRENGEWKNNATRFPIKLTKRIGHFADYMISDLAIEVRPEKTIPDCRVTFRGQELICDDNRLTVKHIDAFGTGLFRIPAGLEKDQNGKVVIYDKNTELKKEPLKDIHG